MKTAGLIDYNSNISLQTVTRVQVLWMSVSDDFFYSNKNMQKGEKAEIKGSSDFVGYALVPLLFACGILQDLVYIYGKLICCT